MHSSQASARNNEAAKGASPHAGHSGAPSILGYGSAMIDSAVLWNLGWGAVAALVIAWLIVSFLAEGPLRHRLARFATVSMYVALLCLFVSGLQGAESLVGRAGFGFLSFIFGAGFLVSLWKLFFSSSAEASAVH